MQSIVGSPAAVRGLFIASISMLSVCAQASICSADSTAADGLTTVFTIDDADPESSVPTAEQAMRRPLDMGYHIMMLSEKAEKAYDSGDYRASIRYWRAVQKAVPDTSLSRRKLCRAYEAAGESAKAIDSCREALGLPGVTVDDNERYVGLLLQRPGALSARDIADVDSISAHLEQELGPDKGPALAKKFQCQLAVRSNDIPRLEVCTNALDQLRPNDPETLVFSWTLALTRGDFEKAEQLIQRAHAAKLPSAAVTKLEQTLSAERERRAPWWLRKLHDARLLVASATAVTVAALAMYLTRKRQRNQTDLS